MSARESLAIFIPVIGSAVVGWSIDPSATAAFMWFLGGIGPAVGLFIAAHIRVRGERP